MKSRTRSLAIALALSPLALQLAAPALADDTGFYVGANVGRVLSSYKRKDIDGGVAAAFNAATDNSYTPGPSAENKDHVMWSGGVGYMFSRNFGIEASYLHLGALKYTSFGTQPSSDGSTTLLTTANVDVKSAGPALAAIAALPMSDVWQLDARVGAYEGKTTSTYFSSLDSNNTSGKLSKTSTSLLVGVGTAVTLTPHCIARLDYMRIEHIDEPVFERSFNVDLVTVGLAYVF